MEKYHSKKVSEENVSKNRTKGQPMLRFNLFDSKETEHFIVGKEIRVLSEKSVGASASIDNLGDGNARLTEEMQKEKLQNISHDGRSCTLCGVKFETLEEQRTHFKLDWHKYNIKQMLLQRDTVKESVFEEIISGDVSSISGSDSDSESESETRNNPASNPLMTVSLLQSNTKENQEDFVVDKSNPKIYFENNLGNQMSVYREVVFATKDFFKTTEEVVSRIENLPREKVWLIVMTGGGHFAGAVFSGNNVLARKTFHRYTVRAKRGTAQGIRDNKQGGHQPKSAGASLRRYNEAALVQDIQNLLESWSEHVDNCDRIFIRVPNNYKWIFFEGKKPPFKKDDSRVRVIPFATRRATFKELEKVHGKLSTVHIHENYLKDMGRRTPREKCEITNKKENNVDTEASSPCSDNDILNEKLETEQLDDIPEDGDGKQTALKTTVKNDVTVKKDKKTAEKDRVEDTKQNENKVKRDIPRVWIELYEAIRSGNTQDVKRLVEQVITSDQERDTSLDNNETDQKDFPVLYNCSVDKTRMREMEDNMKDCKVTSDITVDDSVQVSCQNTHVFNRTYDGYDETLLHVASRSASTDIVKILLEAGADPAVKDCRGRVPFNIAKDKETRSEFRRFMALFPEKYDYKNAQIPSPLTTEMEEEKNRKVAEKKKAQAKARKQRLKEKREVEKQKELERRKREQEEEERNWFQNLSDREKRAVAAERRLGNICFNCSKSLKGLVPFERLSNKYCSTDCVQKHRKISETTVK